MLTRLLSVTARKNFKRPLARSIYVSTPTSQDSFNKREKGLEDQNVRKHEQEVIRKLQEELKKKDEQIRSEQQKTAHQTQDSGVTRNNITHDTHTFNTNEGNLSHNDLLEFRREFLGRIRSIEDDIADIKYRMKKKGL
eukprot:TRINITY_DN1173_c0_g2_i1.p1 TRINITY_DN1173_c0_g2~~TRINITY_DN1173_c0_g2_i1.p1  ORF type:complete len:138 (+),score=26.62 TRINITY_DN1173_c0_g2_i1:143-556(+)